MKQDLTPKNLIVLAAIGFLGVGVLAPRGLTMALWNDSQTITLPPITGRVPAPTPTTTDPTDPPPTDPPPTDPPPTEPPTDPYDPNLAVIELSNCWAYFGNGALQISCNLPQIPAGHHVEILGSWSVVGSDHWEPYAAAFDPTESDVTRSFQLPVAGIVPSGASYTFVVKASYSLDGGAPSVPTELTMPYVWVP